MALPAPGPNSHVVVTGASSGIGAALARGLATRGYPTVLVARRAESLETLAASLPDARALPADLGDPADRARVRDVVTGDTGVVGLVNAAGIGHTGPLVDVAADEPGVLRDLIELNVTALHELTCAAVGALVGRGEGAILNVSSVAAFAPIPELATYAASKAFVQAFSEAVHAELAGTGVSLTTVSPGLTRTEFDTTDRTESMFDQVPSVLVGEADDVAEAAIAAMVAGRRSVVPGVLNQAGALAARFLPRSALLPSAVAARRWW